MKICLKSSNFTTDLTAVLIAGGNMDEPYERAVEVLDLQSGISWSLSNLAEETYAASQVTFLEIG